MRIAIALLAALLWARIAPAADLLVHLPAGVSIKSAKALAPAIQPGQDGPATTGKIVSSGIQFTGLTAGTPYDLRLELADGRVIHGVNMAWYTAEPPQPDAGPLNDDDRKQIDALVTGEKTFYDRSRILNLSGDHSRATALIERIRSSTMNGGVAGEVIWRVELWYFTNDFGGWSQLPQTAKVLQRERFKTTAAYHAAVDPIVWAAELGGITVNPEGLSEITLTADVFQIPATQPSATP
jgi:hypothetical protein